MTLADVSAPAAHPLRPFDRARPRIARAARAPARLAGHAAGQLARPLAALVLACGLTGLAGAASAQAVVSTLPGAIALQPQNVVSLSAQASAEVPQDQLLIALQLLREGSDAQQVQSQLRQALEAALAEARKAQRPGQIEVRTGAFQLFPRYAARPGAAPRIEGWQGQAELVIEGRDLAGISALAGRLNGLQVQRVQPGLSREAREKAEAEVAVQAIARFRARAELVAKQFGFGGYSLREVQLSSGENQPNPMPMLRAARVGAAMAAEEAQPVAPGQTTVTVSVSGSVQLSAR